MVVGFEVVGTPFGREMLSCIDRERPTATFTGCNELARKLVI